MNRTAPKSFDDYIARYPKDVQALLTKMRLTIHRAAPQATEKISYAIPTFYLNGNLVHFAAFKAHVGFYPTSSGITAFKKDLSSFKTSRGAVQFPFDRPLPLALVTRIVKFRVKESTRAKA
jgi:uncharacterized protein YdhG (YjbR/CyaY superfamily)